jgi:hypothetical protein
MIELTDDEALAVLDELAKLPFGDVHDLFVMIATKIHTEQNKTIPQIFTGEQNG